MGELRDQQCWSYETANHVKTYHLRGSQVSCQGYRCQPGQGKASPERGRKERGFVVGQSRLACDAKRKNVASVGVFHAHVEQEESRK